MCPRGRPRGQGRPRGLHLCSKKKKSCLTKDSLFSLETGAPRKIEEHFKKKV